VDAAYGAGAERGAWGDFLATAQRLVGASAGLLLAKRPRSHTWRIEDAVAVPRETVDAYNARWDEHDRWLQDGYAAASAPWLAAIPVASRLDEPFASFFLQPAGVSHVLLGVSREADGAALVFWRREAEPFGRSAIGTLERLWPHFVKARTWGHAQWSPSTSPSWVRETLDLWHLGVLALSGDGRPLYANRALQRMSSSRDGLSLAATGPVSADPTDTRALRAAVRRVAGQPPPATEWLRLRRRSGAKPYEVALRRLPETEAGGAAVLLIAGDPESPVVVDHDVMQRLHGLAPLEAKVAASMCAGASVEELMRSHSLSLNTARWYAQRVREKLEVERQQDVTRLIVRGIVGIDWADGEAVSGVRETKVAPLEPSE
jgi:DNA-binding CsgD family transcriptional regulator